MIYFMVEKPLIYGISRLSFPRFFTFLASMTHQMVRQGPYGMSFFGA